MAEAKAPADQRRATSLRRIGDGEQIKATIGRLIGAILKPQEPEPTYRL